MLHCECFVLHMLCNVEILDILVFGPLTTGLFPIFPKKKLNSYCPLSPSQSLLVPQETSSSRASVANHHTPGVYRIERGNNRNPYVIHRMNNINNNTMIISDKNEPKNEYIYIYILLYIMRILFLYVYAIHER